MRCDGRVALVTGGTRGIGKAIRHCLASDGYEVFFTGRATLPPDDLTLSEHYVPLDLENAASYVDVSANINRQFPALDVLINNAGINIIEPADVLTEAHWREVLEINLTAPMRLTRTLLPLLRRSLSPRVLNLSSIWGVVSKEGRASYTAAKTGLIGLTRTLAIEFGQEGILVNALCPGFTLTELTTRSLSPEERELLQKAIPLGRFAQPGEIAKVACFLCSEENTYITGQAIVADGGFTIR